MPNTPQGLVSALALGALLLVATPAPSQAANATLDQAMAPRVLGKPDAPVKIIEYASLTCSHCAAFHNETFEKLKKDYIDSGKVYFEYRDFPLGGLAMGAAMVARCLPAGPQFKRYFGFIKILYRGQKQWAQSQTPREELENLARLAGMPEDDFVNCLDNDALLQRLNGVKETAARERGVNSTPTFFVNGEKISGNLEYRDFQEVLDKAVAKGR